MKILTVVGARPQFIKAAAVSRVIINNSGFTEVIVHTGQHFDANMSDVFFEQLEIPRPNYNLKIGGLNHGAMTGRMMESIETILMEEVPDWVLVYGDTNSTLAGALAASKLNIPIAHVEAGLRSYNPFMPEEINRISVDRVSTALFCPTKTALSNLEREGYPFPVVASNKSCIGVQKITNVGDVMYDAILYYKKRIEQSTSLSTFDLKHKNYVLCTLHRQENTHDVERLRHILNALNKIAKLQQIVLPMHPRTRRIIENFNLSSALGEVYVVEPLPYLEMQRLQMGADLIITDSGGMQKEAYFHNVPCITVRDQTEWPETVEAGWNQLVDANEDEIFSRYLSAITPINRELNLYGNGDAAELIVRNLL